MAIKSRLEKSTLIAALFHWGWLSIAFFFLDVFHIKDKLLSLGYNPKDLNNLTLLDAQLQIANDWFVTLAPLIIVSAIAGYILAWCAAFMSEKGRKQRSKGEGSFRGLTVTIGKLPIPPSLSFEDVEVKLPLNDFPEKHLKFLQDVISLAYSKEVPAGVGHGDLTLFDHTLNVVNKAIEINATSPNTLCAIAAHDIGKIETFVKKGEEWVVEGKHDEVGANLVAKLGSWWELDEDDRHVIYYAIKYSHKPEYIPEIIHLRDDIVKSVEELRHVDHNVTGIEKEEVVEDIEEQMTLLEIFKQFLQETPLRTSNTANGQKAGGWIKHGHVFVLENYFKDIYLADNHPEVLAAYNELGQKVRFSKVTKELLKQLNEDGLLIKKWGDEKISKTAESLWVIKCNQIQFIKVIIIPLTEDIKDLVGHESYHKGLSVVSSFPRYIREQRKAHAGNGNKPKANVGNKQSTTNKVKEDIKKLKEEKATAAEQVNKTTGDTTVKNQEPNNMQKDKTASTAIPNKAPNIKTQVKEQINHKPNQEKQAQKTAKSSSNEEGKTNASDQDNETKATKPSRSSRRRHNRKKKNTNNKPQQQRVEDEPLDYHEEMASSFISKRKIITPPLPLKFCLPYLDLIREFKLDDQIKIVENKLDLSASETAKEGQNPSAKQGKTEEEQTYTESKKENEEPNKPTVTNEDTLSDETSDNDEFSDVEMKKLKNFDTPF